MTASIFACCAAAAHAEPLEASLSLTVNALVGTHEESAGQRDPLPFAPLPLGELTLRHAAESIRVEGMPPVTFAWRSSLSGAITTRLSLVNATYRHAFAGGWFAGAGQTVYNQWTSFDQPLPQMQSSRVTGFRLEAGRFVTLGRERAEYDVAVNPRMHGVQYTTFDRSLAVCRFVNGNAVCVSASRPFVDPESAAQVDVLARFAHPLSAHGALLYGVRYLNYTARYDLSSALADRNVGFAPVLGYRLKL